MYKMLLEFPILLLDLFVLELDSFNLLRDRCGVTLKLLGLLSGLESNIDVVLVQTLQLSDLRLQFPLLDAIGAEGRDGDSCPSRAAADCAPWPALARADE